MPSRKTKKFRRDRTEISCCLKYSIFSVNVVCWICGLCLLSVGVWALNEKNVFSNLTSNLLYDPAFVLIVSGSVTFLIGFTGCVGSLRENTFLLSLYSILLIMLLFLEIGLGVLTFILKDKGWIKNQATYGLRNFILHYREDPDQQNLIDYIQTNWECCGIDTPSDWDANRYFNCTSSILGSREACGVPFSCCKTNSNDIIANKQCGYDVRKEGFYIERYIYERGCLKAGESLFEENIFYVVGTSILLMITKSFDVSKIINEKGCIQAGEELVEENLIFISTMIILCIFFQVYQKTLAFKKRFYQLVLDSRHLLCSKLTSRHHRSESQVEMTTTVQPGDRRLNP